MDELQELAAWVNQNRDKAGTPEFEMVADRMLELENQSIDTAVDSAREAIATPDYRASFTREEATRGLPADSGMHRAYDENFLFASPQARAANLVDSIRSTLEGDQIKQGLAGLADLPIGSFQVGANIGDEVAEALGYEPSFGGMVNEAVRDYDEAAGGMSVPRMMTNVAVAAPMTAANPGIIRGGIDGVKLALMTPTTASDEEFASSKASQILLGAGGGMLVPSVQWARRAGPWSARNNARDAVSESLRSSGRMGETLDALDNARPGETAGQSVARIADDGYPAGSAEIMGIERMARNHNPTPYQHRFADQAAENVRKIRQAAGGGADELASAKAARTAVTEPMYDTAWDAPVDLNSEASQALTSLMRDNPFVTPHVATARNLLKADGHKLPAGRIPAENATRFYHYLKRALDGALDTVGEGALSPEKHEATKAAKEQLLTFLDKLNPKYGEARAEFARLSRPIERLEVGERLIRKLSPALNEFGAENPQTATQFANALLNEEQTLRLATGSRVPKTLQKVMGDEGMKQLDDVAAALARDANYGRYSTAGRQAAAQALDETGTGSLPRILERDIVVVNNVLSRLGVANRAATMDYLSEIMLDPQSLAALLREATDAERLAIQSLSNAVRLGSAQAAGE